MKSVPDDLVVQPRRFVTHLEKYFVLSFEQQEVLPAQATPTASVRKNGRVGKGGVDGLSIYHLHFPLSVRIGDFATDRRTDNSADGGRRNPSIPATKAATDQSAGNGTYHIANRAAVIALVLLRRRCIAG